MVNHDAFGYLTKYGLELEAIAGLSPDSEPTAADVARLQDLIEDEGVTTVFSETLVSPETAETLARDAGVEADVLDPIEGLADTTADEDYLSLMRANLEALRAANGCLAPARRPRPPRTPSSPSATAGWCWAVVPSSAASTSRSAPGSSSRSSAPTAPASRPSCAP